jgi:hypothetical protein
MRSVSVVQGLQDPAELGDGLPVALPLASGSIDLFDESSGRLLGQGAGGVAFGKHGD